MTRPRKKTLPAAKPRAQHSVSFPPDVQRIIARAAVDAEDGDAHAWLRLGLVSKLWTSALAGAHGR